MATEFPNVIILGAGASKPYKFPTGIELIDRIRTQSKNVAANLISKYVEDVPSASPSMHTFDVHWRILNASLPIPAFELSDEIASHAWDSIDLFLNKFTHMAEFGKQLIARTILGCERELFYQDDIRDNWMIYMFRYFRQQFLAEKPGILFITFNYDRTLEYFLHKMFYAVDREHLQTRLAAIPIIHVFGSLGNIFKKVDDQKVYPFGEFNRNTTTIGFDQFQYTTGGIKTIYEIKDKDDDTNLQNIRAYISNAENIYITGFGFNQIIVDLIFQRKTKARIHINVHDRTVKETEDVRALILECIDKPTGRYVDAFRPDDLATSNISFFRNRLRL